MKHIILVLTSIIFSSAFCQEQLAADTATAKADSFKIEYMQVFAGSMLVVPEGKQWEILSLAFSTDFMPIQVSSVKFKNPLLSGDTITLPFWISEAELHDGDQSDIMYSIKIKVINI